MDAPEIATRNKSGRALTCWVAGQDLQLGMHVQIERAPYMWATVEKIDHSDRQTGGALGSVTLVRLYVHAPGPSIGPDAFKSITCYTGLQRVMISRDRREPFEVSCETHPYFSRWAEP